MKDWKTTTAGIIMFIVGIVGFWIGKVDYVGAIAFITSGIGFWVACDTKLK